MPRRKRLLLTCAIGLTVLVLPLVIATSAIEARLQAPSNGLSPRPCPPMPTPEEATRRGWEVFEGIVADAQLRPWLYLSIV